MDHLESDLNNEQNQAKSDPIKLATVCQSRRQLRLAAVFFAIMMWKYFFNWQVSSLQVAQRKRSHATHEGN